MKIIRSLGLVMAGIAATAVPVAKAYRDVFKSVEYVDNYDGDTFTVNFPTLPPVFGHHLRIRVAHIDSPELTSESVCEKKVAIDAGLELGHLLSKAKSIELINPKRDKFYRLLADVLIDDTILVSKHMVEKKLAYPYEGGEKPKVDWCTFGQSLGDTPHE